MLRDHDIAHHTDIINARIRCIPTTPGSDWRDLPNKTMTLKDGSPVKKLRYDFDDVKQGRSSSGARRGVCGCMEQHGRKCDPGNRQDSDRTLIHPMAPGPHQQQVSRTNLMYLQ